jgi:hypothetical protein
MSCCPCADLHDLYSPFIISCLAILFLLGCSTFPIALRMFWSVALISSYFCFIDWIMWAAIISIGLVAYLPPNTNDINQNGTLMILNFILGALIFVSIFFVLSRIAHRLYLCGYRRDRFRYPRKITYCSTPCFININSILVGAI